MEEIILTTNAEIKAELAEKLSVFSGLKLLHIKKHLTKILALIGRDGIFDEYTKHDISHINYMLESLDWIIPMQTQEKMTHAEWMMIVLSIYFHDLGMLVTRNEYENRYSSGLGFVDFKKNVIDGEYGTDFKDKVIHLIEEKRERFLYQEFVRSTHAERIKYWILEEKFPGQQTNLAVVDEIKTLLSSLDPMFKRDLALICESHHLADFDNFSKYKTNLPYGSSSQEKVNLHYVALILRTADLLHITSDRTPSVEYRLINPSDPLSQEEWSRHREVKAIRPKTRKNKDGHPDDSLPKDTLEVTAYFLKEDGFFGLISFLGYADKQLKESFHFNELAKRSQESKYDFPWKAIDDENIQTRDFEKRPFEFVLDQPKILDLLVGHTLYNDSTVVLRELTQNALDAVKLQKYIDDSSPTISGYSPFVQIKWSHSERTLSFVDNGTGMTLEIIQNHLLKVGSSRYQDENFKKKFPGFSPISRFGIGLLTCFLIANDIDIITKSYEQDKGIILKIRKVHGKYLLKYLPIEEIDQHLRFHGTEIRLYVRSDVDLTNVETELNKWIVLPFCQIELEDNGKKTMIGVNSPTVLIKNYLTERGYIVDDKEIKVAEYAQDGITTAYALRFDKIFREWGFLKIDEEYNRDELLPVGTCIEGIRVAFTSPGFMEKNIYCIVNATGQNAIKTNVARSNVERTVERENLLFHVYSVYLKHISREAHHLHHSIGFSMSWANYEARYLLESLLKSPRDQHEKADMEDNRIFEKALSEAELVLLENPENRNIISINDLKRVGHFWTIESALYDSVNSILREISVSDFSALTLLNRLMQSNHASTEHIDYLYLNIRISDAIDEVVNNLFEVSAFKVFPEQRRIDMKWSTGGKQLWHQIEILDEYRLQRTTTFAIQLEEIELDAVVKEIAIRSKYSLFLLKGSELNEYLVRMIAFFDGKRSDDFRLLNTLGNLIFQLFSIKDFAELDIDEFINSRLEGPLFRGASQTLWERIDRNELINVIYKTRFTKYDNTVWYRRTYF